MTAPIAVTDHADAPRAQQHKRADLHCHSDASNRAAEVLLNAISCPECYSTPDEVYAQARRRGMDFVTITDHDTIDGVIRLGQRDDVLVGEEVTCWFPEDDCKLHFLVWGITPEQHAHLQRVARDVYAVAQYVHKEQIAHAVAHPIYRQNDKLERWHLERLILLFKGFECLNGAHSPLHREAFEPLLDNLSRAGLAKLAEKHNLQPLWPEPWIKARVAGSDDHGLLNIGCTYTEFPPDTHTVADVLQCLRDGTCKPGGESGSSAKLAHTFYSVAVRYYTRHILEPSSNGGAPNLPTALLQMIVGAAAMPTPAQLVRRKVKSTMKRALRRVASPFRKEPPPTGTALVRQLFLNSVRARIAEHPRLRETLNKGLPPLGEHDEMLSFVQSVNRDVTRGIARAIGKSIDDASFTALFDGIGSVLAHQFVLAPYYFAVFHQNRERRLLRQITGQRRVPSAETIRVGLFTDTLDEINGVGRFLRDMSAQANRQSRSLVIHTCVEQPKHDLPNRRNFKPLLSREMPYYPELSLTLPPVLEILDWADRQQFDAIHVSTPGPMGFCGWLVSKMLRVPLLGTYHTDFPAYLEQYTRDHRARYGAEVYLRWLCGEMQTVFTRSRGYVHALRGLGLRDDRLQTLRPGVDVDRFRAAARDPQLWSQLNVTQPRQILYCGRVSEEKNLPLLTAVFKLLCQWRQDVALVIVGDGPYADTMRRDLAGLPAHFLGFRRDDELARLYASADLLVFPSRTDTLGQVVMEAHACGLPAIVSHEGGPKEIVDDGETGFVLTATQPGPWATAIESLLNDDDRRQRMSAAAIKRASQFSLTDSFDAFWSAHTAATAEAQEADARDESAPVPV